MRTKCEFKGNAFSIDVLVLDDESCPVAEFLIALSQSDRRKVDVLLELLGSKGRISNKEHFKKIEGTDLFEFKRHQIRLICFFTPEKKVVICHALLKKQDKHRARDLEYAEKLRKSLLGIK